MNTQASTLPLTVNPFEALVNANAASAAAKVTKKAKAKAKEAVDQSKNGSEVAAKPGKQANPDSKRARAVIIYKESLKDGKKVVIDRFKTELSMTDAGANSYFYSTKKALSQ